MAFFFFSLAAVDSDFRCVLYAGDKEGSPVSEKQTPGVIVGRIVFPSERRLF